MKEENLRQEAYKECKKSQRKETVIIFANDYCLCDNSRGRYSFRVRIYSGLFLVGLWIRSFPHRAGLLLCPCHLEEASN